MESSQAVVEAKSDREDVSSVNSFDAPAGHAEVAEPVDGVKSRPVTSAPENVIDKLRSSSRAKSPTASRVKVSPRGKVEVSLRSLLEAGVHFGHQTSRWDPAMAPHIYAIRNGVHIIHLPKTLSAWKAAERAIYDVVANGGNVMFVGTKKQAQEALVEEAMRCGAFYVSQRWLGGMITNFSTIRKSIDRMKKIEQILQDEDIALGQGHSPKFTKKERLMMAREHEKLEYSLGGIRDMHNPPDLLFVVDIRREEIAIKEAQRMGIPVVALVDTNCNPANVDYPIPSNDDGTRAIRLFCAATADIVTDAKRVAADRVREQRKNEKQERQQKQSSAASHAAAPVAEVAKAEDTVVAAETTGSEVTGSAGGEL